MTRDPLLGKTLDDRYVIESKIAAGGYGTVYRARWVQPGRSDLPVAIKVVHARHSTDPAIGVRFRREAAVLSRLASRHTVHTYRAGEDRATGTQFLVMELLDGESLHARFGRSGPLPWRTVLTMMRQVCESLAETHALGIVHRDLKPANLFLIKKDLVKVLDFGIAKFPEPTAERTPPLTLIGQAIGTPEYMSPEQILARPVDGRSDIYTLGVVMYEMITGARPYPERELSGLIKAITTRRPLPLSTRARWPVPASLDEIVHGCLEREPKDRYANVKQLAHAIDQVLTERHDKTTLRQWDIFGEDDEQTWIPSRPRRRSERVTARAGLQEARTTHDPHREAAIRIPLVDTERMRFQAKGTAHPFGRLAEPPMRMAMGSRVRIDERPMRRSYGVLAVKLLVGAIVLALIGLAIGTILATFV
jgi:serine/threonine protein kinase